MENREEEAIQQSQRDPEEQQKEVEPKLPEKVELTKENQVAEKVSTTKKQYKYSETYDLEIENFKPQEALQNLKVEPMEINEELPFHNDICLKVVSSEPKGSGLNKFIGYLIKGKDPKNGQFEIWRRYKDFFVLREKLVTRWPGCFIPPIPNKTIVGNSEEDLVRNRTRFLNNFLRKMTSIPEIYYNQEFFLFLTLPEAAVENAIYGLKDHSVEQTLARYRQNFTNIVKLAEEEQSEQQKKKAWSLIEQFETYFREWKADLNEYKNHVRKLTQMKTKYFKAMGRVDQFLLPEYELILLNWFNGVAFVEQPPIVLREPAKKAETKENKKLEESKIETKEEKKVQGEQLAVTTQQKKQEEKRQQKEIGEQKKEQEPKVEEISPAESGIINSLAYKQKFEETALQIKQFNGPIWMLYDILKFQLKEIDSILQSIEQCKYIKKQMEFLTRNISINKDQIESLNNKKTTLKTFLMSGNEDEKKSKLANESKTFEDKLEIVDELYRIVRCLVQRSIKEFHSERIIFYKKFLSRAMYDQIGIVRKLMQFHIYQLQLLEKNQKGQSKKEVDVEVKEG